MYLPVARIVRHSLIHRYSLLAPLLVVPLLLTACIGTGDDDDSVPPAPEQWESQFPGGCSDGADNDGDGVFDCDDPDCESAPDCLPGDDDDDSAGGGDDTGDDDTGDDDTGDDDTGDDDDTPCVDNDGDNWCADEDCDDLDAASSPIGIELCDGKDNNCNGLVDDGAADTTTWYLDADDDGYGAEHLSVELCEAPAGYVEDSLDCNDLEPASYPGATEICDEIDNNCDGNIDEGDAGATTWYADFDGDNYGNPSNTVVSCEAPPGFITVVGDCDDLDPGAYPGATEACDESDNNCNGQVDEGAAAPATWHADFDGDGYASTVVSVQACIAPAGYLPASLATDCDDLNATTNPAAVEICDGVDNDCLDGANFGGVLGNENDDDGDGISECDGDCNDGDFATYPGATEDCSSGDRNCDGDPTLGAVGGDTWYADLDGDGYGGSTLAVVACGQPTGYVAASMATDCNDLQPIVYPSASELCDGIDNDCDPSTTAGGLADSELDGDNDGQRPCGGDCDDADPANYTGNTELCDGQDNDCVGGADVQGAGSESDDDGDNQSECQGDCNDDPASGAAIFLNAAESCDAIDSNCNGSLVDNFNDFDGDADPDCTDPDDDNDGDADGTDCDDSDSTVFTGANESCDAVDNDCDGNFDDPGQDECDSDASCTLDGSTYTCTCDTGYSGTGLSCDPELFPSSVLLSNTEQQQLNTWVGSPGQVWSLCYRRSTHGANSGTFHSNCNSFSQTLTVAQLSTGILMGGYSITAWGGGCNYTGTSDNFLFSLTRGYKINHCTGQHSCSHPQYSCNSYGPTFGGGHDWYVSSDMTTGDCNLGHNYACQVGSYGSSACRTDWCGVSNNSWSITDMEVWYR
jgi:hypothetical protein